MVKINKGEKLQIIEVINDILEDIKVRCQKQALDEAMTKAAFSSVKDFLINLDTSSGKCNE